MTTATHSRHYSDRRARSPTPRRPTGPIARALGHAPLRGEAGQPGQPPQAHRHRRRHRPGRRLGRRDPGRTGLPRRAVLLPGLPAPRPLHRRAGRHQRREELPQRRRLRAPAVLRHRQGRRLPRPRVQRAPARADLRRDHRPVRGAGRAVRPRVRRAAGHPLLRRRPGLPHVLRPRPDRASSCCSAPTRRCRGRSPPGTWRCTRAPRCST